MIRFLFENSLFLVAGALAALIWANCDPQGYEHFVHVPRFATEVGLLTEEVTRLLSDHPGATHLGHGHGTGVSLHFLVNDVLMALFFAIAMKEVWESLLPGGALSNPRKAATPLLATAGGVICPALLYAAGAWVTGHWYDLGRGWAIPCATDIAFSYLVARLIFGDSHPAIPFLLLLAIADDGIGLMILAIFYPTQPIVPLWFLLTAAAVAIGYVFRGLGLKNFWWYLLIPGSLSWFSFYQAGIHAALGLVPIIPTMPHEHADIGFFREESVERHDTLNEFKRWWDHPVQLILGLFGLVNAGVILSNVGLGTGLVAVGLVFGKPLGIFAFTWMATRLFRLQIPAGMTDRHVVTLGVVAGIGFTVALFVSATAFPQTGPVQDAVKMGALGSFGSALLAFPIAWVLKVKRLRAGEALC